MNTSANPKTMADTQAVKLLYTAKAHTTGGRDGGTSRTSDGRLDVKLSLPGSLGEGTNPEQLLAVGWAACFTSAIKIVAAQMKVKLLRNSRSDSEIDLCTDEDGYFLRARLNASSFPESAVRSLRWFWKARITSVHTRRRLVATSRSS